MALRHSPYHVMDEEALADDYGEPFRGILLGVLAGALLWALLLVSVWAVLR